MHSLSPEEQLLLQVEQYRAQMRELEQKNQDLEQQLRRQSKTLEHSQQAHTQEMHLMLRQFETLEHDKQQSDHTAELFRQNLQQVERQIETKNEEFEDVLVQLLRKEKQIRAMHDQISERSQLQQKVTDLEAINDAMLDDKIQLRKRLQDIGGAIRKFQEHRQRVQRASAKCLTPSARRGRTRMPEQPRNRDSTDHEQKLRDQILRMLGQSVDSLSQHSQARRHSQSDADSRASIREHIPSQSLDTPVTMTFQQLEAGDSDDKVCLTERASERKSRKADGSGQIDGQDARVWAKMRSTPFESSPGPVRKRPQLMLSSGIFEHSETPAASDLADMPAVQDYFQARRRRKARTPQHHSRKSSLFNKASIQRLANVAPLRPREPNLPRHSELVRAPEQSLECPSIQNYLSRSNLHLPSVQLPSLMSPRSIPMKYSVRRDGQRNSTVLVIPALLSASQK